ncbi:hypothetical protein CISG_05690 [Coccidioides immitis RMSCC 3703]|uniref:Uncharacterized protein n=1 Tax=Coccidioides immitis RMSCC 3703 TaxID=454286 RepID=A0A0J8TST9_COCIT|nr:hypothetical protein CISG_05690 [Coccidioides immitis RMSCC 3703]
MSNNPMKTERTILVFKYREATLFGTFPFDSNEVFTSSSLEESVIFSGEYIVAAGDWDND